MLTFKSSFLSSEYSFPLGPTILAALIRDGLLQSKNTSYACLIGFFFTSFLLSSVLSLFFETLFILFYFLSVFHIGSFMQVLMILSCLFMCKKGH